MLRGQFTSTTTWPIWYYYMTHIDSLTSQLKLIPDEQLHKVATLPGTLRWSLPSKITYTVQLQKLCIHHLKT